MLLTKPIAPTQSRRGWLVAQGIGLIHPDAIDDLPPEAGHHMKQVIDDLRLRAVLMHLQIEGCVHVHGDGLDFFAAFRAK